MTLSLSAHVITFTSRAQDIKMHILMGQYYLQWQNGHQGDEDWGYLSIVVAFGDLGRRL